MYRQFKPIIRWVGSAVAFTAISTSAALAQNTGKLKVGFMLPYTGTFAALGIAIENGFPTPSKKPIEPDFDAERHLQPLLDQAGANLSRCGDERLIGLDIAGHGGGQWQLIVAGRELISVETGLHPDRSATCHLDIQTFADLMQGKITWKQAFAKGTTQISGTQTGTLEYLSILEQLVAQTV